MRPLHIFFVAVAMTAPAYTQTTAPTAPSVTAGAEFKGLRFDWEAVPATSWYQTLLIGHAGEDGDDSGIGGRWDLHSEFSTGSGAVFLY